MRRGGALYVVIVVLASCGAPAHAPTVRARTFPERFGGSTPLLVSNEGRDPVCEVYISPTSENTWGEDWLEPRERIAPGHAVTFGVQAGNYDIQLQACPQQIMRQRKIDVHGGRVVVVLGPTGSHAVVVPAEADGGVSAAEAGTP